MVVASAPASQNDVEAARRPIFTAKTRSHTEIELANQKFPSAYGAARSNVRTRRHAAAISLPLREPDEPAQPIQDSHQTCKHGRAFGPEHFFHHRVLSR